MRRFHRLLLILLVALTAWLATCYTLPAGSDKAVRLAIFALPAVALSAYGAFALALLAHGVLTFRSVPEEAAALRAEVQEAHTYLRRQGVHLD
jgi:Dolichol-phosphate mannosyltransferase subunit 3 (DPM3)